VALSLGSNQAVLQAVAQGLGVGFVSARASAQAQQDGHVACLGLEDVALQPDLYLACLPQRMGDPIPVRFLSFFRDQLSQT